MKNDKLKFMAFYLPQFHTFPENDKWWGKGFTEWTNVRKGFVYYKGQEQPRIPLNNNYYDLSNPETLQWQANLANQYGVYGFCIYHYWFNGKLLLNKPVELLLEHPEIKINYCFSWANEPWSRTWSGKATQVLMPQSYGIKDDWIKHFKYLLPFFKDKRYIKENNCPMFLIYKSQSIPKCKEMMECWNTCAINEGFDGIHFVETIQGNNLDKRDLPFRARVEFEPKKNHYKISRVTYNYWRIRRRFLKVVNKIFMTSFPLEKPHTFNQVAKRSLSAIAPIGSYGGAFIGWDNTARRGLASTLILPPSKREFYDYLKAKKDITLSIYKTDYIFINAWNEWAEGTYLEPDEMHKYDYLEVVKSLSE